VSLFLEIPKYNAVFLIYRDSARAREPLFGHVRFRQLRVNTHLTGHSLSCHSEADIQIRLHLRTDYMGYPNLRKYKYNALPQQHVF